MVRLGKLSGKYSTNITRTKDAFSYAIVRSNRVRKICIIGTFKGQVLRMR